MASNVEQLQKIFVGGLSKDGDENALTDAFSSYGSIQEVSVLRDSSGKSRGFGFVLFDEATSVDDLMKEKKEGKVFYVSGSPVEVKRALPKVDRADLLRDRTSAARHMSSVGVKKVFVGGLANTTVAVDLEAYFSQFGKVLEATVLMDKMTSRSRGFGFVVFEDEDAADKVCAVRNHSINGKLCEVRKAEPRSALLNRKEKEAMNQLAFRGQGDILRQQQPSQPAPLDVGNLNSAIQVLSSLQNLLSAAQLQQAVQNPNPTISNQGFGYGIGQYQGQLPGLPLQNQMNSSNQSNLVQLLQTALANQNSQQGGIQNAAANTQANNPLGSFLGNPSANQASNLQGTNLNALGILSSLAGISNQNNPNIKQDGNSPQLSQSSGINTLPGTSVASANFSYYDDAYSSSSQTSSAYGPVRAPGRSDSKASTYRPY